ncbi:MAG: hypothetical protein H6707_14290 [Deltaproteobacteria bacterium]|nr:hypothetical protein [Deltaproteobacteria bacterium]
MKRPSLLILPVALLCSAALVMCNDNGSQTPKLDFGNPFDSSSPCGPCGTCCSGTVCAQQVSATSCGFGGQKCEVCATGQECINGECKVPDPCGACPKGCCDKVTKECKGQTNDSCGIARAECTSCAQIQKVCDTEKGKCVEKVPDRYMVRLDEATIDTSQDIPFVELTFGTDKLLGRPVEQGKAPKWNDPMLIATTDELLTTKLQFHVLDADCGLKGANDDLGTCEVQLTQSDLSAGKIEFSGCQKGADGTVTKLVLSLIKVQPGDVAVFIKSLTHHEGCWPNACDIQMTAKGKPGDTETGVHWQQPKGTPTDFGARGNLLWLTKVSELTDGIEFAVYDYDCSNAADLLGKSCTISFTPQEIAQGSRTVANCDTQVTKMEFEFVNY